MSSRKRNGSGSKRPNKGKVVQIYESFFRGEDPTEGNPNFWQEFFLLRPNITHLEGELQKLSGEQLAALKNCLNMLFAQCVDVLTDSHQIRVAVALQTLCVLIQGIYKKAAGECNFDVINVLVGFDTAEKLVPEMLERCSTLLKGESSADVKALSLRLLLALASGAENVSQNAVLEYALGSASQPVFEALVHTLHDPDTRSTLGHHSVLLLTLLVNYRKHEGANPFVVQLSILDNELALNGYSQVITASLSDFCWQFATQHADPQPGGWLSSFTSMVGAMFVSDEGACRTQQVRTDMFATDKANNAVLLALYEAVHLNRNFITTLVHSQTEAVSSPPSPTATLDGSARPPPSDLSLSSVALAATAVAPPDLAAQPSNLLATFIEYW
ncbi:hypothetical protein B566_EDAN013609 [Ephemera danica]|nr:hypothetical protein B566_EDAN013609 [Ephemera danica]